MIHPKARSPMLEWPAWSMRLFAIGLSLSLAVPFVAPLTALASDGVAEINHTCAVLTGCFAGDTPGYPVTIDGQAGGSYRLTSNLIPPNAEIDGIKVRTNDIGIDLNKFVIIRSGCEGSTTSCAPTSGGGAGVTVTSSGIRGISVKNGGVTGMGAGIKLGDQGEVVGVRTRWNRLYGVVVGAGSMVSGSTAYENESYGIHASSGSTVSGNTAYLNGDDGIFASSGSTVSGNTAYGNGGDGIKTSSGATVRQNTVRSNSGYGLNLGFQSAYRENVITANTAGTVNGGVNLFGNSCNGSTTCP